MATIDIVNLVETNPITKLSATYNNRLLCKIKSNFTNEEQQLFVASFYCYLNCKKDDFVIDLDNVWRWLDFTQKINAKVALERNFTLNRDYKCMTGIHNQRTGRGGHNKETILMTLQTFKEFCLIAGTEKAKEIRMYFLKLEELLFETIGEECAEIRQQLEDVKETAATQRHKLLLREFGDVGSIVYIVRVKTFDDGNYVIKIGQSRNGIRRRFQEHQKNFDEAYILDCYLVVQCKNFESYLHNHPNIKRAQYTELAGHETERELFLISHDFTYDYLQNIISQNIKKFMTPENDELQQLRDENEQLKRTIELLKVEHPFASIQQMFEHITQQNSQLKEQISELKNQNNILLPLSQNVSHNVSTIKDTQITVLEKVGVSTPALKTTTGFGTELTTLGPRLQKIDPETLTIVKVYETVAEALVEMPTMKRPSITKSVAEHTVYHGFRWLFLDRNLPPDTIPNIPPTRVVQKQTNGYVAKLNETKTEILNVYIDRKTACLQNGYICPSALDKPFKNFSPAHGYYYCLYNDCSDDLRDDFEAKMGGKIVLYQNGVAQYDENDTLVRTFVNRIDCYETMKMSDKTLQKCLDKKTSYNGFKYSYIGSKLFV